MVVLLKECFSVQSNNLGIRVCSASNAKEWGHSLDSPLARDVSI